jgi:hypothetical protein
MPSAPFPVSRSGDPADRPAEVRRPTCPARLLPALLLYPIRSPKATGEASARLRRFPAVPRASSTVRVRSYQRQIRPDDAGGGAGGHDCDMQPTAASDALLDLLMPMWQGLIGALVGIALIVAVLRLARRGRSRMSTALLVTGSAIVGLAVFGILSAR